MSPSSDSSKRRGWIGGWGIKPGEFAAVVRALWPTDEHVVLAPTSTAVEQLLAQRCDVLAGYSLGSLLLLSHPEPWPENVPVIAVAPIIAFCAETGQGGYISAAMLRSLQNRFVQDPVSALSTYFRLTRLPYEVGAELPYAHADLAWGLEALGSLRGRPERIARSRLYAGAGDPLMNYSVFAAHAPGHRLVADARHDFRKLLPEVARHE